MNPPVFPRRLPRPLRSSAAVVLTAMLAAMLPLGAPVAHAAGNQAVHFDGTDDHVKIGTGGAGTGPNPSEFTIETWFNWNGGGTTASTGNGGVVAIPLISKGRAEGETVAQDVNYFLGIDASGHLVADFEQFSTTGGGIQGQNRPTLPGATTITQNSWHHAAATYSTANGWGLYLDGVSQITTPSQVGFVPNTADTSPAAIGSTYISTGVQGTTNGPGFFAGDIDELRIWNTARSQGQISGAMNTEITSAAGLIDHWGMNEGSGTTAADSAGSTPGVLTNGPTWVAGAPALNAPPPPLTNPAVGLNGTSQYGTFGNDPNLNATDFTLELWIMRTGAGVGVSTGASGFDGTTLPLAIPLLTKGRHDQDNSNRDTNYFLGLDSSNGHIAVDFEEGAAGGTPGLNHPFEGDTAVPMNTWHHVAATYDGSVWRVYLDGQPDGTSSTPINQPVRNDSIAHAAIGTAMDYQGTAEGFFAGKVDEARIWDIARSPSQILATMSNEIPSATDLVGRWGMNEQSGTTIADTAGHNVTGTLAGGATRVEGPVLTPVTPNDPPVVDSVTINEPTPQTNDTLSVTTASHDPNSDTVTYTYQWLKNGSDIPGATGATLDMSIGGRGDKGEQISVRVTGHDAFSASDPLTSSTVTVLNTAPSTTVVFDNSNPGTNDILTATASPTDVDASDTVSLTYEWRVNGTLRRTTATTALTDPFDLSQPNNGNTGDTIAVTVTPSDGTSAGGPAVANATVVDALKLPNFLPEETWQTNDRVTTIQRVGNVVYLGGKFTQVMDHSGTIATRNRLAAFDALTGNLLPWNPNANGVIWSLDASADGQTIYVSGAFKKVGNVSHQRIAAVNATGAGAVLPWAPFIDGVVRGITVSSGGTVYLGGAFANANGMPRSRLAAVNGTSGNLLGWNPNADNLVRAVDLDQTGRVIAGGSFMNAGGSAQARVAILDPTSGVAQAFAGPRPTTTVTDIAVGDDPSSFYVTFNNVINAYTSATGARRWSEGGDGNVQGLDVQDGVLYIGGHFHVFNNESRVYLASAKTSDGSLTPWTAHANSVLGVFAVEASLNRLYIGGDFTDVSGNTQQHFAMFVVQDNTSPTRPGQPTGVSNTSSTIDLSWAASTDAGNPTLTYSVYRDALPNPVGSVVSSSTTTVSFVDTGLAPLSMHTYRIQASDGVLTSSFSDPSASIQVMNGSDTAAPVLQSLVMQDQDADGRVDLVVATFDESLAPYTAGTAPWTLANVPSGGTLSSVNVSGTQATLQITEGAGAQDTAVGTFTIAMAANPNGIRDVAGNQSSFAARAPTDGAGAVPTNIIRTAGSTSGLIQPGDTFTMTFSESLAPATVPAVTTITESDPAGPGNDLYEFTGITTGPIVLNSDTYVGADGTSASFANSAVTLNNGRNVKITVGSTCSGSGCASLGVGGQAAITYLPAPLLQDASGNPAVGQITKTLRLF